jgi:hypothetical protein
MSPTALPTAGYFRVSVARDDMKAPELYRDEIERYCNYKRLSLGEVFSDIDRSGFRGPSPALRLRSSSAGALSSQRWSFPNSPASVDQ